MRSMTIRPIEILAMFVMSRIEAERLLAVIAFVGAKILIAVLAERGRSRLGRGYSIVMRLLAVALGLFAVLFLRQAIGYLGWLSD